MLPKQPKNDWNCRRGYRNYQEIMISICFDLDGRIPTFPGICIHSHISRTYHPTRNIMKLWLDLSPINLWPTGCQKHLLLLLSFFISNYQCCQTSQSSLRETWPQITSLVSRETLNPYRLAFHTASFCSSHKLHKLPVEVLALVGFWCPKQHLYL